MPDMSIPKPDSSQVPGQVPDQVRSRLDEADYLRLQQDLVRELRQEVRRAGRQHLFAIGLHALVLVFLAVLLFLSSQRYHDFMLWTIGICLLLFGLLEFLDLDYAQSGHSWLDVLKGRPKPDSDHEPMDS